MTQKQEAKLRVDDPLNTSCRELRDVYKTYDELDTELSNVAKEIEDKIEVKCGEESYCDSLTRDELIGKLEEPTKTLVTNYDNLNEQLLRCVFTQTDRERQLTAGLGAGVPAATIGGGGLAMAAPMVWPSLKSFFKSIFR